MEILFTNMCGKDCVRCGGIQVCQSAAGYYLGIVNENGPYCRATQYITEADANEALKLVKGAQW